MSCLLDPFTSGWHSKGFAQMPLTPQACILDSQPSGAPGSRQCAFIHLQQQLPRHWLQIIVCSYNSPGRGAAENCYLVWCHFHFFPWAGAKIFMLFLSICRPRWSRRSDWSSEQKSGESITIRGVSAALFVEEREKAGGEALKRVIAR